MQSRWLEYCKKILCIFLGRQNGHVQALLIAPILAVGFLGLIVRAANPAVDPSFAKNEVTAQVQQRLNEIQQRSDALGHVETVSTGVQPNPEEQEDPASVVLVTLPPLPESVTSIGMPHHIVHSIKQNETFAEILKKEGLSPQQTAAWISAAQQRVEVRRLQVGRTITFSYESAQHGPPTLRTVSCSINQDTSLVFEKDENGRIQSRIETAPTTLVWRAVGGRITHSLGWAARKIGVPASIIDAVADMGWDLNLSYDLQPGDPFKIIFEEIQHNGQAVKHGKVLAAEIVNKGKHTQSFLLTRKKELGVDISSCVTPSDSPVSRRFLAMPGCIPFTNGNVPTVAWISPPQREHRYARWQMARSLTPAGEATMAVFSKLTMPDPIARHTPTCDGSKKE